MAGWRPKVKTSRLRSPQQLHRDAAVDAANKRSVYTERAIMALSEPLASLKMFLDNGAAYMAVAKLQGHAAKINACCSTSHAVPILARCTDSGPVAVSDAVVAPHHCGAALCTRCEKRPQTHAKSRARLDAALGGALLRGSRVRFITLTIRNRKRLKDALAEMNRASLALRATPEWAHHIVGGARALEVTHNDGVRRRLRKDVAAVHGMMTGGGKGKRSRTYYLETKSRNQKGQTSTTRRDLTDADAKEFLDGLHDSGADIYRKVPWSKRRCAAHGTKGCHACDPTGWHPHHHIIAEGDFWLGLCSCCLDHGRFNCPECRSSNAKRSQAMKDGKPAQDKRWLVRVCGGLRSRDELNELRRRGARRMESESDGDYRKRMVRHHQAFDWLTTVTKSRCQQTKLRKEQANQRRLGEEKGWTPRRLADVDRIERKLDKLDNPDDGHAADCLSCAMASVTGGESGVVDVREVAGWSKALKGEAVTDAVEGVSAELLKYLTKSAAMPQDAMVEFAWAMSRKRRVTWFGAWQGMTVDEPEQTELKSGTQFDILWDAIHDDQTVRRLFFKGPEALCLAAQRGHPTANVDLWPDPDKPGHMKGSAELTPELATAFYAKAAKLIPEQPATAGTYTTNEEGAAPDRTAPPREPEQILVPY